MVAAVERSFHAVQDGASPDRGRAARKQQVKAFGDTADDADAQPADACRDPLLGFPPDENRARR